MTDPSAAASRADAVVHLPGAEGTYRWEEAWGELPAPDDPTAWAHPGLTVAPDGSVLVADSGRSVIHRLDGRSGRLLASVTVPTTGVHGLACQPGTDGRVVWIADQGVRLAVDGPETVRTGPGSGRVVRLDLSNGRSTDVEAPPVAAYRDRPYRPTFVAFDPGSDDVWIADGYGAHLVHRYGVDGSYRSTIGGGSGDTFDTPHAVAIDRRGSQPRLLVADRVHRRLVAFDLDEARIGEIAVGVLTSPSGILALGDLTLVAELNASVAVLDPSGALIGRIAEGEGPADRDGWPNAKQRDGTLGRPRFTAGRFNSPHAMDLGSDGSLYVAEFVLGGRLVRITPIASDRRLPDSDG